LNNSKNPAPRDNPDAAQLDEITALCPSENKNIAGAKTLTVEANNKKMGEVNSFIHSFLEERDCPIKAQMQISVAAEEIFVNIASYAYPDGEGDAEIRISEENGEVTMVFTDSGIPYDPLKKPDPDITLSAEERKIGGLGIFLVRKNMDSVSYKNENGKNILTVKKRIF